MVEQRAYPTLRAVTVLRRSVTEILPSEHCFWNGQTPVPEVPGDDLVSVRFLERSQAALINRRSDALISKLTTKIGSGLIGEFTISSLN